MSKHLAKFLSEFRESAQASARTDRLFGVGFVLIVPSMLFHQLPDWLFCVLMSLGSTLTLAAIVSLAFDNRRARKLKEKPRSKPGVCHL